MADEYIENIVKVYKGSKGIDGFSRIVEIEEIKENEYNLNVTLYVFPEEEVEEIDISKEWKVLKEIDGELVAIEKKIGGYLDELKEKNNV